MRSLRVLMADELNEERVEGQREGRVEGQREGLIRAYASLVQDGIITVETGAEKRECLSEISQRK
mgnify:CR=1 FL=1